MTEDTMSRSSLINLQTGTVCKYILSLHKHRYKPKSIILHKNSNQQAKHSVKNFKNFKPNARQFLTKLPFGVGVICSIAVQLYWITGRKYL